uniref:Cf-2.1 n=1 Tax=Solanum tuberosum TaxID=4113 RepID=M0ZT58_SOLTU
MDTLFELTTEGSDEDENVIALLAIELWSKVPKLDGLQCCERNSTCTRKVHIILAHY